MIKNKKIILAAGIFPPDIGGPAVFAKALAKGLLEHNCEVSVLTYGGKKTEQPAYKLYAVNREQNIFFRYLEYFLLALKLAKTANVLYAFDIVSVGLPCALVKLFRPKIKFIVRLGGDFQWEKAVQERGYDDTLKQYYADRKFDAKEKTIFIISRFVLKATDKVIFNSLFLRDIYIRHKMVAEKKVVVVKNIKPEMPSKETVPIEPEKDFINIIFAGRVIAARNLKRLISAFKEAKKKKRLKDVILEIIGDGPERDNLPVVNDVKFYPKIDHDELIRKISESDIVALVSLTEINSNLVSETLELGKLVILTKESEFYYMGNKNPLIYYIDPLNIDDIAAKIENALDDILKGKITKNKGKTGDEALNLNEVVSKHLEIFNQ